MVEGSDYNEESDLVLESGPVLAWFISVLELDSDFDPSRRVAVNLRYSKFQGPFHQKLHVCLVLLKPFLDAPPLSCDFRCIRCHNYVAFDNNFIQDLFPFSMTQLLSDGGVICVMPRAYDHFRGGLYVGGHPAGSHEDAVSVYCTLCGSWLGWRIHNYRFVIHEGQFVLVVCGDGAGIEAVFPM
ncbi:hypothetical protein CK203_066351 [Vitis vinifera]|uniref:Yippee domain-containing protein n=1 Tax=Vitis vinifera TaxID=29760 RepID=A0A438FXW5_VITVI|nr:hypothetical protein CK203_066351 [Vitis vinifera]